MGNYVACVAACNEVKPYFILICEDKAFACKKKKKKEKKTSLQSIYLFST